MQAQLLVGSLPTASSFCDSILVPFSSLVAGSPWSRWFHRRRTRNRYPLAVSSSQSSSSGAEAAINGHQNYYSVLGIDRTASSADIKKAYRLLARQYHPDVSKHSQAGEMFKSIRRAYETLSNEVTRTQYDRVLRFNDDTAYRGNKYYSPQFEDRERIYRWAELKRRMEQERYWEQYNEEDDSSSEDEMAEEVNQERGPFAEVLRSAFLSLFLLQTLGPRVSVTFSSLMALFDPKLDAGYKIGHLVAWILGGRNGVLLALCIQFASWVCGKTSSSMVTVTVVAMWVASNLARHAPLPTGAVLTLLYMSIKLQVDLT
ncbi:unnamed protein product [Linum trigynum]|uniref:J domain-containing protein n=1 Tax=Linum trigynum TaxID=586398 RepID=A0AAV2E8X4_9ROSI